ncbi:MAG TPA: carbamoyltransferase HypF [Planctomycetaceae bacterium]|nr:carbamoyltransferase HypF [Planctomycetaceae bacterium]
MTGYNITIHGFVQGQGVRPALARLASQRQWTGKVRNTSRGVQLELGRVEESAAKVDSLIRAAHMALAQAEIDCQPARCEALFPFHIDDSSSSGIPAVPVPPDVAICSECLAEFPDQGDRRYRYPLISCVHCGPRFSSITAMPFDRPRTTLQTFVLCEVCQAEYDSASRRRGHAQTIGCQDCGPDIWGEDRHGNRLGVGDEACIIAARALSQGAVVALRGVGGYQLLVEATQNRTVIELRRRKRRATKPFAVLCRSLEEAESFALLDDDSRRALTSPQNPIVVVPRRTGGTLADGIHPFLNDIGLLLPTTAMHARLLELVGQPLVCTSGNLEGAPMVADVDESRRALADIADLWLHHNRPLAHPVDDSVVRPMAGRMVTMRSARGFAPLLLSIPDAPPLVALGSDQKSACAFSNGAQVVLGPHAGDLNDLDSRQRWRDSLLSLQRLYQIDQPEWAVDAHPDHITRTLIPEVTSWRPIWHHHAHIVAALVEHGWLDRAVMGVAADGQGYGPDGTLWGGEVLQATVSGFTRKAAVRRFALPGGDAAARDPSRVALALLSQMPEVTIKSLSRLTGQHEFRVRAMMHAANSSLTPRTSSLGRLFDGIAWIALNLEGVGYVGEPAARLEAACDPQARGHYSWRINDAVEPWELDWRPMLQVLLRDLDQGEPAGVIAERFHRGIVDWIVALHTHCPPLPWVVGGGVFQNRRLCELLVERWPATGPPLGLPGVIPPNDGGLAAGQLAIATAHLQEQQVMPERSGWLCRRNDF